MAGIAPLTAQADVTGTFRTHLVLVPAGEQTPTSEISLVEVDLQNEVNISFVVSGFRTKFHGHFGIAGPEDAILSMGLTLGVLELGTELIVGRFDDVDDVPDKDHLSFVTKRTSATLALGGVSLRNLAILEDTNFPQSPSEIAFGDVVTIEGQTPSGVNIEAATGFCVEQGTLAIKKHTRPFPVVPGCHKEPKPDLLFTFETLTFSGIPISSAITGQATVTCVQIRACELTNTLLVSGGIVPLTTTIVVEDLFTLDVGSVELAFDTGPGTLTLEIDGVGLLAEIGVSLATTINAETNPATLNLDATVEPGVGLTEGTLGVEVERGMFTFEADAEFAGGPPARFDEASFGLDAELAPFMDVESDIVYRRGGLFQLETFWTIAF